MHSDGVEHIGRVDNIIMADLFIFVVSAVLVSP
jgi:hypothetical protein